MSASWGIGAWAVLALAAFLIGLSKTGFPGVGILSVLLTALVVPARQSTGLILPMLILGDLFAVAYYRRHALWGHLARLIPVAASGIVLGWRLLHWESAPGQPVLSNERLGPLLGVIILALLALNVWRERRGGELAPPRGWWFPVGMGLLAGVTTMLANAAGPIMVLYLLAMRLPKMAFVGTAAWYFLLMNCFKVPFSASLSLIHVQSLTVNAVMAPFVVLGALAGIRLVRVLPERLFARLIRILTVLAALRLLAS